MWDQLSATAQHKTKSQGGAVCSMWWSEGLVFSWLWWAGAAGPQGGFRWPGSSWPELRYRAGRPWSLHPAGCWRRWSSHTEVVEARHFSKCSGCCECPCRLAPPASRGGHAALFCGGGGGGACRGSEARQWWGGWWCPGSQWSRCTSSRLISPGFSHSLLRGCEGLWWTFPLLLPPLDPHGPRGAAAAESWGTDSSASGSPPAQCCGWPCGTSGAQSWGRGYWCYCCYNNWRGCPVLCYPLLLPHFLHHRRHPLLLHSRPLQEDSPCLVQRFPLPLREVYSAPSCCLPRCPLSCRAAPHCCPSCSSRNQSLSLCPNACGGSPSRHRLSQSSNMMTPSPGSCAGGSAFARTPGMRRKQPQSSGCQHYRPCSSWDGWVWAADPHPCRSRRPTRPPPRRSGWAPGHSSWRWGGWWWRGAYGAGSLGSGGETGPALPPPPHPPPPWENMIDLALFSRSETNHKASWWC